MALRLTGDSLRKDCLLRFATQSLTPAKPHVKVSVSIQSESVKKVSETHKYQMLWLVFELLHRSERQTNFTMLIGTFIKVVVVNVPKL